MRAAAPAAMRARRPSHQRCLPARATAVSPDAVHAVKAVVEAFTDAHERVHKCVVNEPTSLAQEVEPGFSEALATQRVELLKAAQDPACSADELVTVDNAPAVLLVMHEAACHSQVISLGLQLLQQGTELAAHWRRDVALTVVLALSTRAAEEVADGLPEAAAASLEAAAAHLHEHGLRHVASGLLADIVTALTVLRLQRIGKHLRTAAAAGAPGPPSMSPAPATQSPSGWHGHGACSSGGSIRGNGGGGIGESRPPVRPASSVLERSLPADECSAASAARAVAGADARGRRGMAGGHVEELAATLRHLHSFQDAVGAAPEAWRRTAETTAEVLATRVLPLLSCRQTAELLCPTGFQPSGFLPRAPRLLYPAAVANVLVGVLDRNEEQVGRADAMLEMIAESYAVAADRAVCAFLSDNTAAAVALEHVSRRPADNGALDTATLMSKWQMRARRHGLQKPVLATCAAPETAGAAPAGTLAGFLAYMCEWLEWAGAHFADTEQLDGAVALQAFVGSGSAVLMAAGVARGVPRNRTAPTAVPGGLQTATPPSDPWQQPRTLLPPLGATGPGANVRDVPPESWSAHMRPAVRSVGHGAAQVGLHAAVCGAASSTERLEGTGGRRAADGAAGDARDRRGLEEWMSRLQSAAFLAAVLLGTTCAVLSFKMHSSAGAHTAAGHAAVAATGELTHAAAHGLIANWHAIKAESLRAAAGRVEADGKLARALDGPMLAVWKGKLAEHRERGIRCTCELHHLRVLSVRSSASPSAAWLVEAEVEESAQLERRHEERVVLRRRHRVSYEVAAAPAGGWRIVSTVIEAGPT